MEGKVAWPQLDVTAERASACILDWFGFETLEMPQKYSKI